MAAGRPRGTYNHVLTLRLLTILVLGGCGAADTLLSLDAFSKYQARGGGSRPQVRQPFLKHHQPPSGVLLPEGRPQQQERLQDEDPLASPDAFRRRSHAQRGDGQLEFKSILGRGLVVSGEDIGYRRGKGLPREDKGLPREDKGLPREDKGLPRGYKGSPGIRQVSRTRKSAQHTGPEATPKTNEALKTLPALVEDAFLPPVLPPLQQVSPFEVPKIGKIEPFMLGGKSAVSSLGKDPGDEISSRYAAVGGFTPFPPPSIPGKDEPYGSLPRLIPIGEAPEHKSPSFALTLPNRKSPTTQSPVKSSIGKSPSLPSPAIPLGHKLPGPALRGNPDVSKPLNPPVSISGDESPGPVAPTAPPRRLPPLGGPLPPGPPPEFPTAHHPSGQGPPITHPVRKSPTQQPPITSARLKSPIPGKPSNPPGKSPLLLPKLPVTDSHRHKTPPVRKSPPAPPVAKSPPSVPEITSTSPALGLPAPSLSTKHTFPDLSDEGTVTPTLKPGVTLAIAAPIELPTYKIGPTGIELQGGSAGPPVAGGPPLVTPFNPFSTVVLPGYGQTLGGSQNYYHLPLQIPLLNFPGGGGGLQGF
ncbi:uncharacterized protein [Procambarus clarkii]|uniref:uncharacterized protein n=1 Tax=Procambarus clarkii TaxID=6728 RepID=UPI001E672D3A|nr:proline-rich extensin-like protein EPR1 [Procambarus clarkii]